MQQVITSYFTRLTQYLMYCINYTRRNNPIIAIRNQMLSSLQDFLTMGKKKKMAMYRVNAQISKVRKIEELIAKNNEHMFLQGRKINEIR